MTTWRSWGIAIVGLGLAYVGCGHRSASAPSIAAPLPQRTCLVLSVGGTAGIAHLGAIAATRQAGIHIDCVVGNSMGALVGSMYATAPQEDTTQRFQRFIADYVSETKRDASDRGLGVGLLALGAVLLSGGAAAPALLVGGGGYLVGAATVTRLERARLVRVLDRFYGGATIEQLPIPYVTYYGEVQGQSVSMHEAKAGKVSDAVGGSVANPFIFEDVTPATRKIDPGLDRISMTPIDDACRVFPDARLLVINVTGQASFYSNRMHCPFLEVTVDPSVKGSFTPGPDFDLAVREGFDATARALAQGAWSRP